MKTKLISITISITLATQIFAESVDEQSSKKILQQEESTISTTTKVLIGTGFALLVGTGAYFFLNRDQRRIVNREVNRNLFGAPVIGNQILNQQPIQRPPFNPNAGFDDEQIRTAIHLSELEAAISASLLMEKEKEEKKIVIEDKSEKPTKKKPRVNMYLHTNTYLGTMNFLNEPSFQARNLGSALTIFGINYQSISTTSHFIDPNTFFASVNPDEILVLDHNAIQILEDVYKNLVRAFLQRFPQGCVDRSDFFAFVIEFMRNDVFVKETSRSAAVRNLINSLVESQTVRMLQGTRGQVPVISLSHYISNRTGVCRHYTLALGYLLQRFVEDCSIPNNPLLGGSVHINAGEEHIWCVYLNPNEKKGYHIDALWELWANLGLNGESQILEHSQLQRMVHRDHEIFLQESIVVQNSEPQASIFQAEEENETPAWMHQATIFDLEDGPIVETHSGVYEFSIEDEKK